MKTLDKVYVIWGECGAWEDKLIWVVRIYSNHKQAQKHLKALNNWILTHSPDELDKFGSNPHDPLMRYNNYTGISYDITENELLNTFE